MFQSRQNYPGWHDTQDGDTEVETNADKVIGVALRLHPSDR
jgi:hypothetical protein